MAHPGVELVRDLYADLKDHTGTLLERRAAMDDMVGGRVEPPPGIAATELTLGGRPAEALTPTPAPADQAILYLHGGGYCMGNVNSHRDFAGRLAQVSGVTTYVLEYRLAPEHPFPAAFDDALAAFDELASRPDRPRIAIVGDSAGGGLALAAALALRDAGGPTPTAVGAMSPWTDLTQTAASYDRNAEVDPTLTRESLELMAAAYAGPFDRRDPRISPRFGDLAGLPPLHLQVGGIEVLEDDAVEVAELAEEAEVDVELVVWPELFHVFQAYPSDLIAESATAMEAVGDFVARHLATPS